MKDWNIILLVLLCIACIMLYDAKCGKEGHLQPKSDTIYVTDAHTYITRHDSFIPVIKIEKDFDTPIFHDTVKLREVVTEFFAQNVYVDSLVDSNIRLTVTDTINQNKITSRLYSYNLLKPQAIITHIYPQKRLSFGLQGGIGITPKGLQPYAGVGVNYQLNSKRIRSSPVYNTRSYLSIDSCSFNVIMPRN